MTFLRLLRLVAAIVFLPLVASAAITVATYNVENYTLANRMVEGVYREKYPKPEAERAALRKVVAGIGADVLAVQEMGAPAFLEEFQRELRAAGQDYPHAVVLAAADADRHVAVLSKIPFREVRRHAEVPLVYFGQPERVKRGVLEVVFATDQGEVSLFVVHLKSKFTERKDDPEAALQRALEAEATRDLVLARFPNPAAAKFLVAGDWNDTKGTRGVRALQKRGDVVIGHLIDAKDEKGDAWTHYFRREDLYSRIDYLMVSPGLKDAVVKGSGRVHDGAQVREASDHRPVSVVLDLSPAK